MKISFVIPCYNEEGNVQLIFDEIHRVFDPLNVSLQLVMINDGSKDGTMKNLRKIYDEHPETGLCIVNFSRNFGKEAAIYAGLQHAKGDLICFIDADLQQRPEVAKEMYEKLLAEPDLDAVAAFQEERKEGRLLTFFKDSFYKLINKITEVKFVQGASDFRMIRRNVADAILSLPEYHRFSKGIFSWVGFNTAYIPYQVEERFSGQSKWTFKSLMHYAIDGIIGFSTKGLHISTVLGILFSVFALIYMVVLVVKTLILGIEVPGYVTTLGFVLLLGGIQLLMLGIMGEYIAKTYMQGKDRPIYLAKEVLERNEDGEQQQP